MPSIIVSRTKLFDLLETRYTDDEFADLCFEFGLELDDITTEAAMLKKEMDNKIAINQASEEEILYKIDIPANRYDLACLEGLSIALRTFLGLEKAPKCKLDTSIKETIFVSDNITMRPFVFSAILKNIQLDDVAYNSFIKFQEKLHSTISRNRELSSVGTHDYDKIQGPFVYKGLNPQEISFVPLNQTRNIAGSEFIDFYSNDLKLRQYVHIIKDSDVYPIVVDANNVVCSLPPIINSEHSKISPDTKNVFIEVTATDQSKGEILLKALVYAFSYYSSDRFSIVPVETQYGSNISNITNMKSWILSISPMNITILPKDVEFLLGLTLSVTDIKSLLQRMMYDVVISDDSIDVKVPFYRTDVMHKCDIIEDIAIAYGYNNIKKSTPKFNTVGSPLPINQFSDMIRQEMAFINYTEVLSLSLCSAQENVLFSKSLWNGDLSVQLENPKSLEYQVVRSNLYSGLLKTIECNQSMALPLKLFEVSDVVLKDKSNKFGASNERRLAAIYCDTMSSFEHIHGCLDHIMKKLSIKRTTESNPSSGGYYLKESDIDIFFREMSASIIYNKRPIGTIGTFHPSVVQSFGINYVITGFEINIEPFL